MGENNGKMVTKIRELAGKKREKIGSDAKMIMLFIANSFFFTVKQIISKVWVLAFFQVTCAISYFMHGRVGLQISNMGDTQSLLLNQWTS